MERVGQYASTIEGLTLAIDQRLIDLGLTTQAEIDQADQARADAAAEAAASGDGAHAAE